MKKGPNFRRAFFNYSFSYNYFNVRQGTLLPMIYVTEKFLSKKCANIFFVPILGTKVVNVYQ